jgi:DNA-binding transcriptional MerR regulator
MPPEGEPNGTGSGGQGGTGGTNHGGTAGPPPADTIPKAEADRLAAAARKDAEKALLAQFGENVTAEQIKKILDDQKAAEDAKKDEATRAREEADREKTAALAEKDQAASEKLAARVEKYLLRAGVGAGEEDDEKVEALIAAARGALGALPADSEDEAIRTAVKGLKERLPALFGTVKREGSGAAPPRPPRGGGGSKTPEEERKARLERIAARTGIR